MDSTSKNFINKCFDGTVDLENELPLFLVDYIISLKHPEEDGLLRSVGTLTSLFLVNKLSLIDVIKNYCNNTNTPIYTLTDLKTGAILKTYI